MAIFNSYVKLPEGSSFLYFTSSYRLGILVHQLL